MTRKEDPYSQGLMIVGIVAGWILLISVIAQLEKPIVPKFFASIGGLFGLS